MKTWPVIPTLFLLCLAAPVSAQGTFAGTWETTYGLMTLTQEGAQAKGFYLLGGKRCTIEGQVEKAKLTFRYQEPDAKGTGWFELAADGGSFTGRWQQEGETTWQEWAGKRVASSAKATDVFDGLWDSAFGRIRLIQNGLQVHGVYAYAGGATLAGKVEGKRLTFDYQESKAEGKGWFELAPDGHAFQGKWKAKGETTWADWAGARVQPVPGRLWLVVIEAPWEGNLADQEYSFGNMLRA